MGIEGVPRPEYPRPQFVRADWINLNGTWEFEIDHGRSGKERGLYQAARLKDRIKVPFCPESKLSGITYKDFMAAVWYRRDFEVPASWAGSRIMLHFGAVDYDAEVWVNGVPAGAHRGGYTPFELDITPQVRYGGNTVTLYAQDDVRSGLQPRGKQSSKYASHGCDYTRTTGIWQTVWLERVPDTRIAALRVSPDPENGCAHIVARIGGTFTDCRLVLRATAGGKIAGSGAAIIGQEYVEMTLPLSPVRLWQPGDPFLYGLEMELYRRERLIDRADSYFGLRSLGWKDKALTLNGKPLFQRLVLDQGFYPDGIYTAPADANLKKDIELSMAMGFNGARLHQKVFEPRFLYWADRLGYLVWGEQASWGLDITTPTGLERFLPEWIEALERDFNHPALIGWCPFNETKGNQDPNVLSIVYRVTKMLDPTRPVIDTSGYTHVATDVYDAHDYEQDTVIFKARHGAGNNSMYVNFPAIDAGYSGQPYFLSEYGGIWWNPGQTEGNAWGYGKRPQSESEFLDRYERMTRTLLENPKICAFCYTQLYDVEQEVNGLYTYDRKPKFDPDLIRRINTLPAAVE